MAIFKNVADAPGKIRIPSGNVKLSWWVLCFWMYVVTVVAVAFLSA